MQGASGSFRQVVTDYDRYVPIVQGALENLDLLIVGSQRSNDGAVFQAAPRHVGDRAVEVEVVRRTKSVDVRVLVYPVELLPSERDRFRIREGDLARITEDDGSQVLLGKLLASIRRDLDFRSRRPGFGRATKRVSSGIFFRFKAGRITWFLGALLGLGGVAYVLFYAPDGDYQNSAAGMATLAFGAIPFLGGLWGRSGPRGAFTGFLAVLVPAVLYALAITGQISAGLVSTQALAAIASQGQFQGVWTYVLPFAFAIAGLVAGGVGGIVGAWVFPLLPKDVAKTAGI